LLSKATTGVSEFKKGNSGIKIFPNPAKDNINVSFSREYAGQTEITVFDLTGKIILNSFMDYNGYVPLSFDISALKRGIYFLFVKTKLDTSIEKFSVIK
jgi:hypothetical protein